jgi:uncharacterized protein (DUF1330 family)
MKVENAVYPTQDQLKALADQTMEGPIVMVNLLKFREKAVYKDGRPDNISGAEAYMRYAEQMRKIVEREGGRFLFGGNVRGLVIGEADDLWDVVGIVEYPSREEFLRIVTLPEVQEISVHREAGLAGQLLIQTVNR